NPLVTQLQPLLNASEAVINLDHFTDQQIEFALKTINTSVQAALNTVDPVPEVDEKRHVHENPDQRDEGWDAKGEIDLRFVHQSAARAVSAISRGFFINSTSRHKLCSSRIRTLNDSGTPGSAAASPFTIAS